MSEDTLADTEAAAAAAQLIESIAKPYRDVDPGIRIGASVGIALAPFDGDEPEQLLKSADLALYRAKSDGNVAMSSAEVVPSEAPRSTSEAPRRSTSSSRRASARECRPVP